VSAEVRETANGHNYYFLTEKRPCYCFGRRTFTDETRVFLNENGEIGKCSLKKISDEKIYKRSIERLYKTLEVFSRHEQIEKLVELVKTNLDSSLDSPLTFGKIQKVNEALKKIYARN